MNTNTKDVVDTSIQDANLFAELASVENDLNIMFDFQQKANQAAIWTFNAWTTTDAFIEREKSLEFIERLEKHSMEADAIKAQAELLVNDLKERKRELTKKLKSKTFSPQMQAEREQAEAKSNANAQAIFNATQLEKTSDAEVSNGKENASESDAAQKNAKAVETVKPQKKRSSKKSA